MHLKQIKNVFYVFHCEKKLLSLTGLEENSKKYFIKKK